MKVTRAVVPAAGLGTRFLPVTLAVPKELLPLDRRPAIHHIVKEAADCGIETVVLVLARGKDAVMHYFLGNPTFAGKLKNPDHERLVEEVRDLRKRVELVAVYQDEAAGLGHAVLTAAPAIGDNPFVLMLPDDHFIPSPLPRLLDVYDKHGIGGVVLKEVLPESTGRWGIVVPGGRLEDGWELRGAVEKPKPESAPSNLAILGRYVLPPSVFGKLRQAVPGALGEIQITDSLNAIMKDEGMFGLPLPGTYLDLGTWNDYLLSVVQVAMGDKGFAESLADLLGNN